MVTPARTIENYAHGEISLHWLLYPRKSSCRNANSPRLSEMLSPLNFRLGVNEKRKVFMRVDERLFYIF